MSPAKMSLGLQCDPTLTTTTSTPTAADTTAAELAQSIVDGYADWMEMRLSGYHYTMSAVDMSALSGAGDQQPMTWLPAWMPIMTTYSSQIQYSRAETRRYWSTPLY